MPRTYPSWKNQLNSLLWRTEADYELARGESLRATNTTEGDLHELFSFGWSAEEAARAITETLGLR